MRFSNQSEEETKKNMSENFLDQIYNRKISLSVFPIINSDMISSIEISIENIYKIGKPLEQSSNEIEDTINDINRILKESLEKIKNFDPNNSANRIISTGKIAPLVKEETRKYDKEETRKYDKEEAKRFGREEAKIVQKEEDNKVQREVDNKNLTQNVANERPQSRHSRDGNENLYITRRDLDDIINTKIKPLGNQFEEIKIVAENLRSDLNQTMKNVLNHDSHLIMIDEQIHSLEDEITKNYEEYKDTMAAINAKSKRDSFANLSLAQKMRQIENRYKRLFDERNEVNILNVKVSFIL